MFRRRVFEPILAGASLKDRGLACIGAIIGIALTGLVCSIIASSGSALLLAAPIGASAVLLFAVPASPLAQPWSIVGGNTISSFVGVFVAHLGLPIPGAAGLAVGLAILTMSLFRCLHPPGGAAALTAVIGGPAVTSLGLLFPLAPVALNSLALVALGWVYHRGSGHSYPHQAVPIAGHVFPANRPYLHSEDLDRALDDLGETFDVSRSDLELLFRQMEYHAECRSQAIAIGLRRPSEPT